jgi:hypothetical protein
MQNC